jgi:hypothetical protein
LIDKLEPNETRPDEVNELLSSDGPDTVSEPPICVACATVKSLFARSVPDTDIVSLNTLEDETVSRPSITAWDDNEISPIHLVAPDTDSVHLDEIPPVTERELPN